MTAFFFQVCNNESLPKESPFVGFADRVKQMIAWFQIEGPRNRVMPWMTCWSVPSVLKRSNLSTYKTASTGFSFTWLTISSILCIIKNSQIGFTPRLFSASVNFIIINAFLRQSIWRWFIWGGRTITLCQSLVLNFFTFQALTSELCRALMSVFSSMNKTWKEILRELSSIIKSISSLFDVLGFSEPCNTCIIKFAEFSFPPFTVWWQNPTPDKHSLFPWQIIPVTIPHKMVLQNFLSFVKLFYSI